MTRQIEFVDTDMAGIMHFSNFFRLMEATEHAFLMSLGFSLHRAVDDVHVLWPRVQTGCEYFAPLIAEDRVDIQLRVRERADKWIRYDFLFVKKDEDGEMDVAEGTLKAVCARLDPASSRIEAIEIPGSIASAIDQRMMEVG
jgi:acyl-CoA thioesterase FadM